MQPVLVDEALRAVLETDEAPEAAAEGEDGEADDAERPIGPASILLIDDSLSIRKFVGRMLESAGFKVDTAVDGEEGLRKIAVTPYSLVITDLEMPKVNGYEVLQALRGRAQTQDLPVIVMTTRAGEKHRHMALTIGASAYVAKPVDRKSTRLNSSHSQQSRMPSSA